MRFLYRSIKSVTLSIQLLRIDLRFNACRIIGANLRIAGIVDITDEDNFDLELTWSECSLLNYIWPATGVRVFKCCCGDAFVSAQGPSDFPGSFDSKSQDRQSSDSTSFLSLVALHSNNYSLSSANILPSIETKKHITSHHPIEFII